MKMRLHGRFTSVLAAAFLAAAPLVAWAQSISGTVTDGGKRAVSGATVYLVPAADVAKLAKAPVLQHPAQRRQRRAHGGQPRRQPRQVRAGDDRRQGRLHASPRPRPASTSCTSSPTDDKHLPGGTMTNKSMTAAELAAKPLAIQVSGKCPANATYVGSSKCMKCHDDYADFKKTAHKLGIAVVGKPSKLQDFSRFPGLNDGPEQALRRAPSSISARLRQGPRLRQVPDLGQAARRRRDGELHRDLLQGQGRRRSSSAPRTRATRPTRRAPTRSR